MGRPIKNTIDYFPHYTKHSDTLMILEQTFGNDGYAFWFKLLEMLGNTEGHIIDTDNTKTWLFLVAKTHLSEQKCTEILELLAKLEAIDPEMWSNKAIWCQHFVDGIADVYKKRGSEIPSKSGFCRSNDSIAEVSVAGNGVSVAESTQSKVKKSKEKNKKELFHNSSPSKSEILSEEAIEFSKYFEELLPKTQKITDSDRKNWAKTYDELTRLDNRPRDEIYSVVAWARKDEFWGGNGNFLSACKLRHKSKDGTCYYDIFLTKFQSKKAHGTGTTKPGFTYVPTGI